MRTVHAVPAADRPRVPVTELMMPIPAVPETIPAEGLLFALQDARTHLVVVADEFGGTAGIASLEDVVEEIVGEIDDEHDPPPTALTVVERPGEYLLSGSLHPDEVLEQSGFALPEGDFDTLAGFVLEQLGEIPRAPGATITHDGWTLTATELDRLRIATVRLVAPPAPGPNDEAQESQA